MSHFSTRGHESKTPRALAVTLLAVVVLAVAVTGARAAPRPDPSPLAIELAIRSTFARYGLSSTMVCIARRESHLNPAAVNWRDRHANGRGSFGLFQIGRIHVSPNGGIAYRLTGGNPLRLLDWRINIEAARLLVAAGIRQGGSGLGPWGGRC